jgi:hypothetical protein
MISKNKKILMRIPFFIGIFFGNPFKSEIYMNDDISDNIRGMDIFICILYHLMSIIILGFTIFYLLI